MSIAAADHPLPPKAVELAAGRPVRPVWLNQLGGLTCAIIGPADEPVEYLKWSPHHHEIDLVGEAERLRWAGAHVRCPEVIDSGADAAGLWLHTHALPGTTAVAPHWSAATGPIVTELGRALRHFHDQVPVADCPWTWSVPERLTTQQISARRITEWPAPPTPTDLVVCTADACAPNTLMCPAGPDDCPQWCGFVDLGDLGVADRWADLSVALWSLTLNFDSGWEEAFLAAYGIARDEEKLEYYRGVYDATNDEQPDG